MRRDWGKTGKNAVIMLMAAGLMSVAMSNPVQAQRRRRNEQTSTETSTDPARALAREHYTRGQEAFRTGDWADAQTAFEAAYAAVPNPVVLLSIAETQERQNNIVGTVATLERYLAERADAPDRAAIEARIRTMKARPATLAISSTPTGARIAIDGSETGQVTPSDVEVTPGTHTVRLTLPGHAPSEQPVTAIFATRHTLAHTLNPARTEPRPTTPVTPPVAQPPTTPPTHELPPTDPTTEPVSEQTSVSEESVLESGEGAEENAAPNYTGAYVAGAIGGAALVVGTVFGFLALDEQSKFDETPNEDSADRGERLALFADVSFGVAAGALATGLILYMTAGGQDEEDATQAESSGKARVQLAPSVSPGFGGVSAQIEF